ncbi:MAG: hypothetical protein QF685_10350 [Verrucomicrobiota bacterium]|jgi:hypothetical protein|nr:hypothetical protein [Verrucomicrobiota bacterium]
MKITLFLWLAVAVYLTAAEPRYQLRSLIQEDGSLLHIRMDTQTGKTWRLDRTLNNRLWTSLKGKATETKLGDIELPQVRALDSFTLEESIHVLVTMIKKANDGAAVPIMFLVPVADPAVTRTKAEERIVPPARSNDPGPAGIDPNTGLPFRPTGHPLFLEPPKFPDGIGRPPGFPDNTIPHPPPVRDPNGILIDPTTGLPLGQSFPGTEPGGLPTAPRRDFPRINRLGTPDANTIRIRGLKQELKNQTALGLLTVLLNSADTPLRCVIDEDIIYFVPETSTVNLRGGKTARPEYEENWVEIGEKKGE